jgi:hypothetical protein
MKSNDPSLAVTGDTAYAISTYRNGIRHGGGGPKKNIPEGNGGQKSGVDIRPGSNSDTVYGLNNSSVDEDEESGMPLIPQDASDPSTPTTHSLGEKPTFLDHAAATLQVSRRTLKFMYCFLGLQFSYLIWVSAALCCYHCLDFTSFPHDVHLTSYTGIPMYVGIYVGLYVAAPRALCKSW